MCTPDGFLFSREAILENLLAQKKANKRKLAAWKAEQEERAKKVSRGGELVNKGETGERAVGCQSFSTEFPCQNMIIVSLAHTQTPPFSLPLPR